ncbi:MAG: tryptophan 7-halogenase [Alphaproteobacteria bacterium]|nr:tryptophan 7-halogenase [Alphaproteobacteria bacterium]
MDVLILGGGLSGGLLARQLRRSLPEASVALVEPDAGAPRVGESMVELGANYLNRRLGLSHLLYREHLPKNGLRFFFDREARDLPMGRLSEIGQSAFSFHPSFQVDRARLDDQLLACNEADGVRILRGWRARGVERGRPHAVTVTREGATETLRARWVVDATGRRRLLGRQLGLHQPEPRHVTRAAWCRVEGFADLDAEGPEPWRARCHHSSRGLATSHFMLDRGWIWVIPLREGRTSVGQVGLASGWRKEMASREGLMAVLREGAALRSLLRDARPVDLGTAKDLAYSTTRYVSAERWALVGEAAAFTDPLFSPGTDLIAWQNDLLTDLIRRDLAGEDLAPQVERVDAFHRHIWRLNMGLYVGQYDNLGSFDVWRLRYVYDVFNYFNNLTPYLQDAHLDPAWLDATLAHAPVAEATNAEVGGLFAQLSARLRAEGRLFEGNADGWDEGLFDWGAQRALRDRSPASVEGLRKRLYVGVRQRLARALRDGWARPPAEGWIRGLFQELRLYKEFAP